MGLFSALFSGVNGINANGNVISVIGDNIANVNTVGFKASRGVFEDILAGAESNIGLGSRVAGISPQFSQGGFESTSNVTDMAIDGKGFFVLRNSLDNSIFYSRAGQFAIDKNGFLSNNDGYRLRGFTADETTGAITANIGDIQISQTPVSPRSSSTVVMAINLNSNSTSPAAFSSTTPSTTSNFSAGVTVYDSLGNGHLVTVYFRKAASNSWTWHSLVDGGEITGGTTGTNVVGASGAMTFNTDGSLLTSTVATNDFDFINATANQTITFDFGTPTGSGGTGLTGATQFGTSSAVTNITQNGFASGSLKSIAIEADGTISGNYTNGTTKSIAQVLLVGFNNQEGLSRSGSNNYIETLDSGAPVPSTPGSGGKGTIVASTLEQSNVDLANELIKMVIIQRGFQANSRTISTVNDMLSQLVTLGQG